MQDCKIAVVLGAGLHDDGRPNDGTVARAVAGAHLALAHPALKLILAGSRDPRCQAPAGVTEASVMGDIVTKLGVATDRQSFEDVSRDTIGNAILVNALHLQGNSGTLYIVTSPFHVRRAMFIFQRAVSSAWTLQAVPSEVVAGDDVRGATEDGGIGYASRFFKCVQPGNVQQACARLLEMREIYRGVVTVERLARQDDLRAA